MKNEIKLNDIADDLLILNKATIDTLFDLDNCSDCIALYVFYYKTAKWQKTNIIKANDEYIKKSLKWGTKKILTTKQALKEAGLIDIVQRRKDGKIEGWYIKISYIVKQKKIEDIKITVEDIDLSNNSQNQQVDKATSGFQETNALKEYIKCLKKEIEMLKKERKKETSYDKIINSMVEDEEVKNSIYEFIKMRKLIKKPMTDRALTMLINKLEKLSSDKDIQIKILEKSILKNWTDIYELKGDNNDGYIRKCSNDDGSEYAEFV